MTRVGVERFWVAGCCLSGALIIAEFLFGGAFIPDRDVGGLTHGPVAHAANDPPQRSDYLPGLLARPIFSPRRKPPPEPTAPTAVIAPPPRLAAIIIGTEGRSAIFEVAGTDRMLTATEGQTLNQWKVKNIGANQVLLQGEPGYVWLTPHSQGAPDSPIFQVPSAGPLPGNELSITERAPISKNADNDHF